MKQLKRVHLKTMIVGLVFGAMSVLILNTYFPSPIQNAYASDCPDISDIEGAVKYVLNRCVNDGHGNLLRCI